MKKILFLLLIPLFALSSCKKDDDYDLNGTWVYEGRDEECELKVRNGEFEFVVYVNDYYDYYEYYGSGDVVKTSNNQYTLEFDRDSYFDEDIDIEFASENEIILDRIDVYYWTERNVKLKRK